LGFTRFGPTQIIDGLWPNVGDQYYTVDESTSPTSYVAKPGNIAPTAPIVTSDPTNDAK
jgi:hypothetical protein